LEHLVFDRGTSGSSDVLSVPAAAMVRTLASFWDEARLRADDAKSTSIRPAGAVVPWRTALEELLNVGYGLQSQCRFVDGAWEQVRWRTTPSAGALYPFEVFACVVGEGSYIWDIEVRRLLPCNLTPLTADELTDMGIDSGGERIEALLVVVARPWLSMKKYRQRGYPYCHLDVGHVTTNLAMYSAAVNFAPTVHLRFSRTCFVESLGLGGLCREPVAVLSFAGTLPDGGRTRRVEIESEEARPPASVELPGSSEIRNWESLAGMLSFHSSIDVPCPLTTTPLLREPSSVSEQLVILLVDDTPRLSTAAEWRSVILSRRSAKGFQGRPLDIRDLGRLLAALRVDGLRTDCVSPDAPMLGLRLIAVNVDGLAGVFAYSANRHAVYRLETRVDDLRPACMRQRTADGAAALLLFHTRKSRLLDNYSAFAEAHFHAAQLGQRLHLAATRLDAVGMTCIGGFDGERCAALGRLEADEEPVYVILLGVPDESAVKHDRLQVAFSHGFATEEG
jgi:SagB-type dehydrogenase family enzyme